MGTLSWVVEAWKALLEWVDANKGADGKLHQLRQKKLDGDLIADFISDCNEAIPQGQNTFDNTVQAKKIESKLERVWEEYRLSKYKLKPAKDTIANFYNEGTLALDWDLLGERLKDVYTKDEIAERKAKSLGRSKRNADEIEPDDSQNPPNSSKRLQTNPKDNTPTIATSGPVDSQEPTVNVQTPEGQTPGDQISGDQTAGAQPKVPEARVQTLSQQPLVTTAEGIALPKLTELVNKIHQRTLHKDTNSGADVQIFMDKILTSIRMTSVRFAKTSGITDTQKVIFDSPHIYPMELENLLRKIVIGGEAKRKRFDNMQQSRNVGYPNFLRSFIAAAVTVWCFQTLPKENQEVYEQLRASVLGDVLRDVLDPVVEAALRKAILENFVDGHVVPTIDLQSRRMAEKILTYIRLMWPWTSNKPAQEIKDIIEFPDPPQPLAVPGLGDGPEDATTEKDDSIDDYFDEPEFRSQFRLDLIRIFTTALTWRSEKQKNRHEHYHFSFPSFDSPFVSERMRREEEQGSSEIKNQKILLCLLPIVQKQTRSETLGGLGPRTLVSKGVGIPLQ